MHRTKRDNLTPEDRPSREEPLLFNTQWHWWWGVPIPVRCWLRGHLPVTRLNHPRDTLYVRCGRCGAMPTLSDHVREKLDGGWQPPAEWLDDLDGRNGWSRHHQGEAGLQVVVAGKIRPEADVQIHVGGRGSETPWDVHVKLLGVGVYANLGLGGGLAHFLTRGGHSRDLRLAIFHDSTRWEDWTVQWALWTPDWARTTGLAKPGEGPAKWRSGYEHPLAKVGNWLWGKREVDRDVREEQIVAVDLGDDLTHLLRMRLTFTTAGRARQNPRTKDRRWEVDWDAERGPGLHGIGLRTERTRDGEAWTRGRVFGSSLSLTHAEATDGRWVDHAVDRLRAWVGERRAAENHPGAVVGG
jgi:hypothetical protein